MASSFLISHVALILITSLFHALSIEPYSRLFPAAMASASMDASTDREALLAFRAQLWSDPSGALSSWNGTSTICAWYGVSCSRRRPRVTALDLRGLRLAGPLSPHLGNLSFLRSLHLQENRFAGTLPDQLGRLFRLRELNVSSNLIVGAIPQNLTRCSELAVFDMAANTISGVIPPEISRLSKLRVLRLGHNHLTGAIPSSICNISSLDTLDLNTNNLTGEIPRDLGLLPGIRHMQISINNIMGTIPPSLYNASSLVTFALASNQLLGEFPSDLGFTLRNLQTFHVCLNQFSGPMPLSLNNVTGIRSIRMSHNLLSGELPRATLANLPDLVMYNIGFNPVTGSSDDIVTSLANSSKLEYLAFDETLVEGVIPETVGNLSSSLKRLYAGGNRILGNLPPSIGHLKSLTLLNLSHNLITGHMPIEIGQLKGLQMLGLAGNRLSAEVPAAVGNLTQLSVLELFGNELSGRFPASLGNLQRLLSLDLSDNKFNGSIPRRVFDLLSLTSLLNFSRNSLMGSVPEEIGRLENVASVDLSHNMLERSLPDTIGKCRSLEFLSVSHNQLSGRIPDALVKVTALRSLDLSSNRLSGTIPAGLGDLQALQFLNLSFNDLVGRIPQGGIFTNTSNVHLQGNPRLCLGTPSFCLNKSHRRHLTRGALVIIPLLGASALLLVLASTMFFFRRRNPLQKAQLTAEGIKGQPWMVTYEEILRATNNFDPANLIGKGGCGSVYKGILGDGFAAAIKVLDLGREGASESFTAECEALRNVRHRNLVKLVTSCSAVDFRNAAFCALIYEFMVNGSLEDWIRGRRQHSSGGGLDTMERLGIAVDVARAVDYLHHDCEIAVVHGDLKPSNVMIGQDMVAKVGDFGLAKLVRTTGRDCSAGSTTYGVKGSVGYIPPEYGICRRASTRGDVYSYGIMLLELFTGKSPTDAMFTGDLTLERWVRSASTTSTTLTPTRLADVLDPQLLCADSLVFEEQRHRKQEEDCLASAVTVALSCTADHPDARPQMRDVLRLLKDLQAALPKPREIASPTQVCRSHV